MRSNQILENAKSNAYIHFCKTDNQNLFRENTTWTIMITAHMRQFNENEMIRSTFVDS